MKKLVSLFAASVAASSFVSVSSTLDLRTSRFNADEGKELCKETTPSMDKFAPRFDGLRFIETLVTAHR